MAMLFIDLLIVHRRPHVISFREAATESAVWIAIGLSFSAIVAWGWGAPGGG